MPLSRRQRRALAAIEINLSQDPELYEAFRTQAGNRSALPPQHPASLRALYLEPTSRWSALLTSLPLQLVLVGVAYGSQTSDPVVVTAALAAYPATLVPLIKCTVEHDARGRSSSHDDG